MQAFDENGTKYNMLNSTCLNLLDFIRAVRPSPGIFANFQENIKSLVKYIVEKYRKVLESVTYVELGKTFILRYDQNHDFDLRDDDSGKRESTGLDFLSMD
jgi:protein phosphatase-4 regulatory subunit 3